MTKQQLTDFIMSQTNQFKKTNLMHMHLADLEKVVDQFQKTFEKGAIHEAGHEAASQMIELSHLETAEDAYENNRKLIKCSRIDTQQFRKMAVDKIASMIAHDSSAIPSDIAATVISTLLENKTRFYPINETEKLMLETIPMLSDFHGVDSAIDGKHFLQKVSELHGVPISTLKALMVSLCRKGFYEIKGIKSGQKRTTVHLQERGIQYLKLA